ncbi:hypothetical protein SAMN05660860_02747 [Geoalkalibacter ferrihydriticus]|uniref:Zinc-regulated TonB-dependent outer membrane receptor n=2 Tax=Geoalkalibacter ferrihydriticus TaxID=392333 RepID=A0A0C2DR63_9BACT|nr:hypothetical protein [Geoalkalibacter ferrihydriticus]KIH75929.1 hypothetical protein GFER_13525 [Geoalkalibacter ferrihydriticus DSM 17813]SDM55812.1 hypothetical protein SAMN05660860_02747 [Geoalkalibacter ferrihydriticus]
MRSAKFFTGALAALCLTSVTPVFAQPTGPVQPEGLQPFPLFGSSRQITSGTAFNPAISVILDGKYYTDNRRGEAGEILEHAAGFDGHHGDHDHGHGELSRGFNLDETEIVFSATVDNYFDAMLNLAVDEDGIEVEEVFGVTRRLPAGLTLKFGKFLSGIGYINQQHPHDWDFADQTLVYELMFGDHGINDIGLQLTWLPKLPVYTLFGVETLQGRNEGIANTIDHGAADFGGLRERSGPRLFTGFVKVAPDLGFDHALQLGLFGGGARLHQEDHSDDDEREYLEGDSWFAGVDAVYKYDAGRSYGHGNLTLQGEYIYRVKDLRVAAADDFDEIGDKEKFKQDGFYVQAKYGFAPRWTAAARLDMVGLYNRIEKDARTDKFDDSRRYSANLTFNPTEFSRLRMQFNHGDIAQEGGGRENYNQFFVQYQIALGVHGAHKF